MRSNARQFNMDLLSSNLLVQELCHQFQRFSGLGQLEVIPEGVRQGLEHYELRVISRRQQRALKNCRAAQQDIARARDRQAWRPALQIREQRREDWILAIGFARVLTFARMIRIGWL